MSPQISAEVNTLVIVMPRGKPPNPPVACWGIVTEKTDSGLLRVRLSRGEYDETYVPPEHVIPFVHTDGTFKDPQRIFAGNEEKITLHMILSLLIQQGVISESGTEPVSLPEPSTVIPIQENTLAIIMPGHSQEVPEPCWALVLKRLLGGNYEVQIGRFRYLKMSKIIIRPEQIIPVYLTDGSFKSPRHAVRQLRAQLFLHLLLMFYSREGTEFLRQLAQPLSNSNFVLVSRRDKTPKPEKPK